MKALKKLRTFEPVRLYGYTFAALIFAALVGKGILSAEISDYALAGVTLLIGGGAVEGARSKVSPLETVRDAVDKNVVQVTHAVKDALDNSGIAVPPEVQHQIDDAVTAVDYYGRHARRD